MICEKYIFEIAEDFLKWSRVFFKLRDRGSKEGDFPCEFNKNKFAHKNIQKNY